jgi:hypothetical protein
VVKSVARDILPLCWYGPGSPAAAGQTPLDHMSLICGWPQKPTMVPWSLMASAPEKLSPAGTPRAVTDPARFQLTAAAFCASLESTTPTVAPRLLSPPGSPMAYPGNVSSRVTTPSRPQRTAAKVPAAVTGRVAGSLQRAGRIVTGSQASSPKSLAYHLSPLRAACTARRNSGPSNAPLGGGRHAGTALGSMRATAWRDDSTWHQSFACRPCRHGSEEFSWCQPNLSVHGAAASRSS